LLECFKKKPLYDSVAEQWNAFMDHAASHVALYRSARDQLRYARTLIDIGLRDEARRILKRVQDTRLFDASTSRWFGATDADGRIVDTKYYAADRLEFIAITADFDGISAASDRLKGSEPFFSIMTAIGAPPSINTGFPVT
jgi:hypothetical protein